LSTMAYGVYGRGQWPQKTTCYQPQPSQPATGPGTGGFGIGAGGDKDDFGGNLMGRSDSGPANARDPRLERLADYDKAIMMIHRHQSPVDDSEKIANDELSALVQLGLGSPLDLPTFASLANVQADLRYKQSQLASLLEMGQIGPEDYVNRLTFELQDAMKRSDDILGRERFLAIFGKAGLAPEHMIDKGAFYASRKSSSASN
jgi:hypothetical protein